MTVILLRHGRSVANTAHTLAGRTPGVDLDDRGRAQARDLADRVAGLPIAALVRSPLRRCGATLEPLSAQLGLDPAHPLVRHYVERALKLARKLLAGRPAW